MLNRYLSLLFILVCIFIASSLAAAQDVRMEISGTVKYKGIVIPHIPVTVTNLRRSFSTTKNADLRGQFKFTQLPVDKYTILARSPRLGDILIKIIPGIGNTNVFDIDFEVSTAPGQLKGEVTDDGDKPIAGALLIYAPKDDPNEKVEVKIEPDGTYKITEIPKGDYILTYKADGYVTKTKEKKVDGKEKVNVELKPVNK